MKFGKYLASRQLELPEYSGHFIDYKSLKNLLNNWQFLLQLPQPPTSIDGEVTISNIQHTLKENKASFFSELNVNWKKSIPLS